MLLTRKAKCSGAYSHFRKGYTSARGDLMVARSKVDLGGLRCRFTSRTQPRGVERQRGEARASGSPVVPEQPQLEATATFAFDANLLQCRNCSV